jgi:hypothetical protein
LVQNGAMNTKLSTPSTEVRLTIPVTAEVHDTFTRIAKAGNMPVGRAMGEWLADTIDAAMFMAQTMEKARSAPRLVAQELHSYALGLGDQTTELLNALRAKGAADRADAAEGLGARAGDLAAAKVADVAEKLQPIPPSCNTGGKVTGASKRRNTKGA